MTLVLTLPSTLCNDGWQSSSAGPGTCSHHGGVDYNHSDGSPPPAGMWVILAIGIILWTVGLLYFNSYKISRWWKKRNRK